MTEETGKKTEMKQLCTLLYGMFAASMTLQFFEETMLFGFLVMVLSIAIAYFRRDAAQGMLESHFHWLIRTFWIGTGVLLPISLVLAACLILFYTDMNVIINASASGDPQAVIDSYDAYFTSNYNKIMMFTIVSMLPAALWWLYRCWTGYALLRKDQPVDRVERWL